jgi:hypothetical protein
MEHRIEITPAKLKYAAAYQGEKIGEFRVPETDSARWLIANGHAAPEDRLTTYRNGRPALTGSVAWLAGKTVEENDEISTRWRKFRPFVLKAKDGPATVCGDAQDGRDEILEAVGPLTSEAA